MPEDARKGFELVVEKLADLSDDATTQDVEEAMQLTEEEQTYSDALTSTSPRTAPTRSPGSPAPADAIADSARPGRPSRVGPGWCDAAWWWAVS